MLHVRAAIDASSSEALAWPCSRPSLCLSQAGCAPPQMPTFEAKAGSKHRCRVVVDRESAGKQDPDCVRNKMVAPPARSLAPSRGTCSTVCRPRTRSAPSLPATRGPRRTLRMWCGCCATFKRVRLRWCSPAPLPRSVTDAQLCGSPPRRGLVVLHLPGRVAPLPAGRGFDFGLLPDALQRGPECSTARTCETIRSGGAPSVPGECGEAGPGLPAQQDGGATSGAAWRPVGVLLPRTLPVPMEHHQIGCLTNP